MLSLQFAFCLQVTLLPVHIRGRRRCEHFWFERRRRPRGRLPRRTELCSYFRHEQTSMLWYGGCAILKHGVLDLRKRTRFNPRRTENIGGCGEEWKGWGRRGGQGVEEGPKPRGATSGFVDNVLESVCTRGVVHDAELPNIHLPPEAPP